MTEITVVDFGAGNTGSVAKALAHLGAAPRLTADPEEVRRAARVVFPGVGAFGDAMGRLEASGLAGALRDVVDRGAPVLGICIGLQVLFESSEEAPGVRGLGLLRGRVRRFPSGGGDKVPQMGWNQVDPAPEGARLFAGVAAGAFVYFVHSFYAAPDDAATTAAQTDYAGIRYASAVARGALEAVQFHPEKSGAVGLRILRNWLEGALEMRGSRTGRSGDVR